MKRDTTKEAPKEETPKQIVLGAPDVLSVQISKTADGSFEYLQILSGDQFSLNIVLIAKKIVVKDERPPHDR